MTEHTGRLRNLADHLDEDYDSEAASVVRAAADELDAARVAGKRHRRFPVMGGPSIPWSVISPHGDQAFRNHSQTLERLAERGGLDPREVVAVLDSEYRTTKTNEECLARLNAIVANPWRSVADDPPKEGTDIELLTVLGDVTRCRAWSRELMPGYTHWQPFVEPANEERALDAIIVEALRGGEPSTLEELDRCTKYLTEEDEKALDALGDDLASRIVRGEGS